MSMLWRCLGIGFPRAGVTGSFELLHIQAWNQTWNLYRSSTLLTAEPNYQSATDFKNSGQLMGFNVKST